MKAYELLQKNDEELYKKLCDKRAVAKDAVLKKDAEIASRL